MLTWTIGSGGLIGSAINSTADDAFVGPRIPWSDPAAAAAALTEGLTRLRAQAHDRPWSIIWAAGAGTTSSEQAVFDAELATFRAFLEAIAEATLEAHAPNRGVFVLISSAGGVHAGSTNAPFDKNTAPSPISAYGRAKLTQEEIAVSTLGAQLAVVVCRVSNAYGPGQDLTKLQGLVSRLAVSTYRHEPLHLFVPLTTVRDYIFTTDIAASVHAWIAHAHTDEATDPRVVIVASGKGTSIAELIRTASDVSHRKIPIAMTSHPSSKNQPADSRFTPTEIPGHRTADLVNLPTGIKVVFDDIQRRLAIASDATTNVR